MAANIAPAGEEAATTTPTPRRRTSTVWDNYTINTPADGGAPTATCLGCGLKLCAGSSNGTSHLRRHPTTKRCQELAAKRVELGRRRQSTSPPTTAATDPSSPGNDNDDPSPPVFVVGDDDEDKDRLWTVDGIYIPELYDKLIAEGLDKLIAEDLDNIERSSESAEHLSAASNDVPAVPPQAASSSTMWFMKKTKERQVKRQKTGSDANPVLNLNSKTST